MVKMRLFRMGDKKNPIYRVVVVDSRKAATGEYIDCVGHYNPTANPVALDIDVAKAQDWLKKGVQPTETVKSLLVQTGAMEKPAKLSAPKTKEMAAFAKALNLNKTALVVMDNDDVNVIRAAANLPKLATLPLAQLSTYEVVVNNKIVMTKAAVEKFQEVNA